MRLRESPASVLSRSVRAGFGLRDLQLNRVASAAVLPLRPVHTAMTELPSTPTPWALGKSIAHFARPSGNDLLARTQRFADWASDRTRSGLWPYSRVLCASVGPTATIEYDDGKRGGGLNFASQDYLAMNNRPEIVEAAQAAMRDFGVHSAGSAVLLGNTTASKSLERALGEFLGTEHVVLFPTGWAAGFGTITGLVRPNDYIVLDELSHACLQTATHAATRNVIPTRHLDIDAMLEAVRKIRAEDTRNGIMVVTESLFSMDSDTPDLARLQEGCRALGATLMVDVAHDLGAIGPDGRGHLGLQNLIGKVDLVMGSFSKTFASNGGFMATHKWSVRTYMKAFGGSHTFSNALSPVQAATVLAALEVVRSPQGAQLREDLLRAVNGLRSAFATQNITCMGNPSAIVPVPVGQEAVARIASWLMFQRGVLANLVEFPAVAVGKSRFRMQVMSSHSDAQVAEASRIVTECIHQATAMYTAGSEKAVA